MQSVLIFSYREFLRYGFDHIGSEARLGGLDVVGPTAILCWQCNVVQNYGVT